MTPKTHDTPSAASGADESRPRKVKPTPAQAAYKPIELSDVVSGQFDEDEEALPVAEADLGKRVLAPEVDSPKLHKVLAQAGMGSRLEMEKLIAEGRVAVNNEPAHVGQRVQYGDQIKVNGKPIRIRIDPPPARVIAYHKPAGEIVSHDDPQNRPSVFRKLPRLMNGKWQSVGRLDLNTEGLLLFTSSGELANQLMHPRFGLEREYAVRVLGALSKDEKQKLLDGVMLDDGPAQFGSIEDGGGEGSNCWYRVTISEGRNREVRRMMESVGHAVSRLIRIRYGAMVLPHGLRRGAWLELDEADIRALMRAAGTTARPRPVTEPAARTNRNDRRPRTGGQGRAGTAVPRAKPAPKPNRVPGAAGEGQPESAKTSTGYIGAESFNRLKKNPGGTSRGGRGGSRSR
ncbi:pseudouridine synthase [Limnohabitans planktonicus]|uniref:Pseudouridine synthase n=1 Tax=Limnohabitans planktonicus II-D5 TaxID=1293045 RepID=A0A2T7UH69_9BURK|nr:pseudouridine synthase [Limnohabitans planktonicus]PVE44036.1 23S rRNA pseudouridylate synthase B [Limnohabitans planktonicus II-D5]